MKPYYNFEDYIILSSTNLNIIETKLKWTKRNQIFCEDVFIYYKKNVYEYKLLFSDFFLNIIVTALTFTGRKWNYVRKIQNIMQSYWKFMKYKKKLLNKNLHVIETKLELIISTKKIVK